MSTVIVLGGGGFLAGHICRRYRKLGWRVISIGRRANPADGHVRHAWQLPHTEFADLLSVERPDICVNAAGRASVPASMTDPLADFEASTILTFRILDDLRRRSAETVYIHLSSAAVYGNPESLPINEDALIDPISPYGWHKHLSEQVVAEHSRLFGMKAVSLRVFSAYGAGLRRQVVWDLAARAIENPEKPLLLHGRPEDSRDFVHGSDVATAVEVVARRGALQGEIYNLAGGVETRIRDLAELILMLLGRAPVVEFDNVVIPGAPSRWHADIGMLRGLGFHPHVPLEEGIREVIDDARTTGA